jgi:hypothetical protein
MQKPSGLKRGNNPVNEQLELQASTNGKYTTFFENIAVKCMCCFQSSV